MAVERDALSPDKLDLTFFLPFLSPSFCPLFSDYLSFFSFLDTGQRAFSNHHDRFAPQGGGGGTSWTGPKQKGRAVAVDLQAVHQLIKDTR